MRKNIAAKSIHRIIDANINRAKEGLRVCEEIARFVFDERRITAQLKNTRHKLDAVIKRLNVTLPQFLEARDSRRDVGRDIYINELNRGGLGDIYFANMQRIKESLRVLEEFSKLDSRAAAVGFKKIRYEIYALEKSIIKEIPHLR